MDGDRASATFACQRCLQPVNMNDAQADNALDDLQKVVVDQLQPPFRQADSARKINGFMHISDGKENQSLGTTLKACANVFDLLSSTSEIEHAVCNECTDIMIELMDNRLKLAESECNDYNCCLQELEQADETSNIAELQKELTDLEIEEKRLIDELAKLKRDEDSVQDGIKVQEEEMERINIIDEKCCREEASYTRGLILAEDEHGSTKSQVTYADMQLKKLKRMDVLNTTFSIVYLGEFGTINSFRLGRLPLVPVEWWEINAAWGQTALLMSGLARTVGLTFERYRLVPYGNHSYIEVLKSGKELPLYGSGDIRDRKFDAAMVAFLNCLDQFKEEVQRRGGKDFCLPYRIEKSKIGDTSARCSYSVKIQYNTKEHWTEAMKLLLTNLKWALAWVSSTDNPFPTAGSI